MRYRLPFLLLIAVLSLTFVINVPAAPAPDPAGILDIGPPKHKTAEQYLKDQIEFNSDPWLLSTVSRDPEIQKLPSVAAMKDPCPWLARHLRVKPEDGVRRLRFTFRAGKRPEQVAIINAFLRANIELHDVGGMGLKSLEECLQHDEKTIFFLERFIESGQLPHRVESFREEINYLRTVQIPEERAQIARLKQYAVIKWAR